MHFVQARTTTDLPPYQKSTSRGNRDQRHMQIPILLRIEANQLIGTHLFVMLLNCFDEQT
jgi:hypothetical protein